MTGVKPLGALLKKQTSFQKTVLRGGCERHVSEKCSRRGAYPCQPQVWGTRGRLRGLRLRALACLIKPRRLRQNKGDRGRLVTRARLDAGTGGGKGKSGGEVIQGLASITENGPFFMSTVGTKQYSKGESYFGFLTIKKRFLGAGENTTAAATRGGGKTGPAEAVLNTYPRPPSRFSKKEIPCGKIS